MRIGDWNSFEAIICHSFQYLHPHWIWHILIFISLIAIYTLGMIIVGRTGLTYKFEKILDR